MNNKRLRRENKPHPNKRSRNIITFEMKLDIVKRYENKERSCDIARALNLSQSTVRTILLQSDKIKERSKRLASLMGTKFLRPRSQTMENMEKRLAEWIKYETDRNNPVSLVNIQEKARELYETIRVELNDVEAKPFVASHGWLDRFKKRMKLFNINSAEEAQMLCARAVDSNVVDNFISNFKIIVDEGGYSPKQIFNLDEFYLCWKRLPDTSENKSENEDISVKDRLTLILGANASGDCKLKPVVIYHSPNPISLRGYSKDHLPVVWRHNTKGTVTSSIFTDYFCNRLTNELKDYCARENIPFKILLVLDDASYHPQCLEDFSENIKILFLPPSSNAALQRLSENNTESYYKMLQPMHQGVTEFFRAHYLHLVFCKIVDEMTMNPEDVIQEYLKTFNIKNALDIIGQAWAKVDQNYLKFVWYRLWPDHAGVYKPFELHDNISKLKQHIILLGEIIGLKMDRCHVSKHISPPRGELTPSELKQLKDEDDEEHPIRSLSTGEMVEAFQHVTAAITIFDRNDYNRERSFKVIRNLESAIECYKQMYKERRKNSGHNNMTSFIKVEYFEDDDVEAEQTEINATRDDTMEYDDELYEEEDPIA